jgi:hypothetical protein
MSHLIRTLWSRNNEDYYPFTKGDIRSMLVKSFPYHSRARDRIRSQVSWIPGQFMEDTQVGECLRPTCQGVRSHVFRKIYLVHVPQACNLLFFMHMCRMLAGTKHVEGAAHTWDDCPSCLLVTVKVGKPGSDLLQFHQISKAPQEEKRDHFSKNLQGATLDSYSVTMETHCWKLLQFQENSYKQ